MYLFLICYVIFNLLNQVGGDQHMELNMNSPAYYTNQYGVNDAVYDKI